MKTLNPFAYDCKFESHPNLYTYGVEVEFWGSKGYFEHISYGSRHSKVLGVDGAGQPTAEYRSPVFKSTIPQVAVKGCHSFTTKVLNSVRDAFKVVFAPSSVSYKTKYWCDNCNSYHINNGGGMPFGIHFSLGGRFLTDGHFTDRLERAIEVQKLLVNRLESEEDIALYQSRENSYPGRFNLYDGCNAFKVKDYTANYRNLKNTPGAARLIEFRFMPSCEFSTIVPYLQYITVGGTLPTSTIKFDTKYVDYLRSGNDGDDDEDNYDDDED